MGAVVVPGAGQSAGQVPGRPHDDGDGQEPKAASGTAASHEAATVSHKPMAIRG
jgi:hypothetical protein